MPFLYLYIHVFINTRNFNDIIGMYEKGNSLLALSVELFDISTKAPY